MATPIDFWFDAVVSNSTSVDRQFDCIVSVPFANIRYQEMSVGLASKTLSDSFSCVTYENVFYPSHPSLDDTIEGSILDYHYRFKVDELSVSNYQMNITGRYDQDAMLFNKFALYLPNSEKLSPFYAPPVWACHTYLRAIAQDLGLTPRIYCRNWAVKTGSDSPDGTYQQKLQSLVGWLGNLPSIDVNCFIRNNDLYVVQRGYEWNAITGGHGMEIELMNDRHVQFAPTIHAKRIRTESNLSLSWPKNAPPENAITDKADPLPFTGIIEFGDAKLEYLDGYLQERVEGTKITRYTYVDIALGNELKKYLEMEEMVDTEEETANKTVYHYQRQGEVIFLYEEERFTGGEYRERAGSWDNNYADAVKVVTTRSPLGNSWYGVTTTNEDTEEVMTSLTQGGPASEANRYMIDMQQNALNAYYEDNLDLIFNNLNRILDKLLGRPIISTNWPVDTDYGLERGDIRWLADWTDKLNNAIEVTVTMTIYDKVCDLNASRIQSAIVEVPHIVDFTDMIKYDGVYYCLQSNNVSHTPDGIRQDLTLVRWYRSDWCIPVPRVGE